LFVDVDECLLNIMAMIFNESSTQMPQNSAFWAFIRMLYISRMVNVEACGMLRLAQVMMALVKLPLLSSIWAHVPAEAIIAERDILLVLLWGEIIDLTLESL